jgi:prepilin-type N-terminal cleavage/methylation domain-containing protein/prepilin-type processing-associated H-X9-DG protein
MRSKRPGRDLPFGFTLIELLVVTAIIGVLISMMLPAIQSARENARRIQCTKHLMQIGVALANYSSTHRVFPPGVVNDTGPITSLPVGYHFGWAVQILPFLNQANAYRQFNFNESVYARSNSTARSHMLESFNCPSDGWGGISNYAACHHDEEAPIDADNHGVFYLNSRIGYDDIPDGSAFTIFVGEISRPAPGGWAEGTRATLRNTGFPINADDPLPGLVAAIMRKPIRTATDPDMIKSMIDGGKLPASYVGGFRSRHPGGANFLLGDGSVQFIADRVSEGVYRSLGNRADGNLISDDDF